VGAQGTTTIDFGAFPGAVEAQADVTGQTGLVSTSLIEAWVFPVTTADHSADEHLCERLRVMAVFKQNDQFTVRGFCDDSPAWRGINYPYGRSTIGAPSTTASGASGGSTNENVQNQRLYGVWTIAWVWN
jgi:hypothetical protein